MYPLLLPLRELGMTRDAFIAAMRTRDIGLGIHYPSVPGMTYYRKLGWNPSDFPVAERIGAETVTLPLFPAMADTDVDRVCDALLELLPR
jgi:dTDP-4-amino-4,6-dideoxygalactose transaminase